MRKKSAVLLCAVALIAGFILAQFLPLPYTAAGRLSEAKNSLLSSITSSENNLFLSHHMQNPPYYRLDDCMPLIDKVLSAIDVGQTTGLLPQTSDALSAIRAFWEDMRTVYRSIAFDINSGKSVENDDPRLCLARKAVADIVADNTSFPTLEAWSDAFYHCITAGDGASIAVQLHDLCRSLKLPDWSK